MNRNGSDRNGSDRKPEKRRKRRRKSPGYRENEDQLLPGGIWRARTGGGYRILKKVPPR